MHPGRTIAITAAFALKRIPVLVPVLVLSLGPLGCALELGGDDRQGHPPVARASASPTTIPENDGFLTAVTLDASESADPFDDPEGQFPLSVRWRVSGDEFRFESGDDRASSPVLRFRGDRPATIELEVTDADGLSTTTRFNLQLSATL